MNCIILCGSPKICACGNPKKSYGRFFSQIIDKKICSVISLAFCLVMHCKYNFFLALFLQKQSILARNPFHRFFPKIVFLIHSHFYQNLQMIGTFLPVASLDFLIDETENSHHMYHTVLLPHHKNKKSFHLHFHLQIF